MEIFLSPNDKQFFNVIFLFSQIEVKVALYQPGSRLILLKVS